ncbi:Kinesin motor domain [Carpediemonas membranifera]|uniref:Kinesin motor domain n=1 Tax=Carpediemonas membranifera TaxID=201153 RepID=A0A8J6E5N2_9EUKA|nr:Kinesin motor domain [Carpediemonas membranifera]|eukprot:KAG9396022.1 Kinesin motor domain [Carpediemonas membranifera]
MPRTHRTVILRPLNSEERYMQLDSVWERPSSRQIQLVSQEERSQVFSCDQIVDNTVISPRGRSKRTSYEISALANSIVTSAMASSIHAVIAVGSLGGGSSYTLWGDKMPGLAEEVAKNIRRTRPQAELAASFIHVTSDGVRDITTHYDDMDARMDRAPTSYQECGLVINGVCRFPIRTDSELHHLIGLRLPTWLTHSNSIVVSSGDEATILVLYVTVQPPSGTYQTHTILFADIGDLSKAATPADRAAVNLPAVAAIARLLDSLDGTEAVDPLLLADRGFLPVLLKPFIFGKGSSHIITCIGPTARDSASALTALELMTKWSAASSAPVTMPVAQSDPPMVTFAALLHKQYKRAQDELKSVRTSTSLADPHLYKKQLELTQLQATIDACERAMTVARMSDSSTELHALFAWTKATLSAAQLHRTPVRPCLRVLHPNPSVSSVYYMHITNATSTARKILVGRPEHTTPEGTPRAETTRAETTRSPATPPASEAGDEGPTTALWGRDISFNHLVLLYCKDDSGSIFLAVSPGGKGAVSINGLATEIPQATENNDRILLGNELAFEVLLTAAAKPRVAWDLCLLEKHVASMVTMSDIGSVTYKPLHATFNAFNQWLGDPSSAAKTYEYLRSIRTVNPAKFGGALGIITRCTNASVLAESANKVCNNTVIPVIIRDLKLEEARVDPTFKFLQTTPFHVHRVVSADELRIMITRRATYDPVQFISDRGLIGIARLSLARLMDTIEFSLAIRPPCTKARDVPDRPLGRLRVVYRPTQPEGVIRRTVRDPDEVNDDDDGSDDGFDDLPEDAGLRFDLVIEKINWPSPVWGDVSVVFSLFDERVLATTICPTVTTVQDFRERFSFSVPCMTSKIRDAIQRHTFIIEVWGRHLPSLYHSLSGLTVERETQQLNIEAVNFMASHAGVDL